MPTKEEYSALLRPLLQEGLRAMQPPPAKGMVSAAEIPVNELSDRLGGLLQTLERQHAGASSHVQSLLKKAPAASWDGDGELAFLLYYLHNPPPELRAELKARPVLERAWDTLAQVAPAPAFTPDELERLRVQLASGGDVYCNKWGDIYGFGTYEQMDWKWAWTLLNYLMNYLTNWVPEKLRPQGWGIRKFEEKSWAQPVTLYPGMDGRVRIAVIGDWGAGQYRLNGLQNSRGPACAVMETLGSLEMKPDYIIHLGDTYYAGTGPNRSPSGEEHNNLVNILRKYPALAYINEKDKKGNCFTLNSNHEMYGGAHGYFDVALQDPLFSAQRQCSYFALEFGKWIIAGIDSAYFDPSTLYMSGGLGDKSENPQYAFLQNIATMKKAQGKKVILMSHHTGISTEGGSTNEPLWSDVTVTGGLRPDYWYWGHTHLGVVYNSNAASGAISTRCIGHGSMPFAIPPGLENCGNLSWYANTRLTPERLLAAVVYSAPRAKNGFAVLTLEQDRITEEIYDIGSTKAVWSHSSPS